MGMPESQHTEWNELWRDEYLAQVCGFANAQGDTLVIGHTWDGAPLPGITLDDPSPAAVKRFRQLALRSRRLDAESLADSNAGLLDRLKLAEGAYLKRAAVLLFHPDPSRHHTGAFIKIGNFEHDAHICYHNLIEGDLFTQARQTQDVPLLKYLKASVRYEHEGEDLLRMEIYPVPREALLNAPIHRDYVSTAPGQIRHYDDKLILWNPAILPPGWTEQTLLQPHISLPHNPDVANAFFRAGEIEAWGRGIERIFAACRAEHAPEPTLKLHSDGLWLEFPYDPAYLRRVKQGSNKAAEQVTDPVTDPVTNPVPPEITRVLELLTNEAMPPSVIQQRLGLKHRPTFRANYLHPALAAGLIEMTLPDKPNSRLQKYRLTEAGRRALNTRKGAV